MTKKHIDVLLEGSELSTEAKEKVQSVFEAALSEAVEAKTAEIQEQQETKLQEAIDEKTQELTEQFDAKLEEALEHVDSYVSYAVTEWMEDNKLAIESGTKVELAESMLSGMSGLLMEHNVKVPEGSSDIVESSKAKAEEAQSKLDEQIGKNARLVRENENLKRASVIADVTEGLSDSQVETIVEAAKGLTFKDAEDYSARVKDLVESYFPDTGVVESEIIEEEENRKPVSNSVNEGTDYISYLRKHFRN